MTGYSFPAAVKAWVVKKEELVSGEDLGNGVHGRSSMGGFQGTEGQAVIKLLGEFKTKKDRDSYVCGVACIAENGCSAFSPLIGFCAMSNTSIALVTRYAVMGSLTQAIAKVQNTGQWPIGFGHVQRACVHYGIAHCLNLLHQTGMVHGGLKPNNVLFTKDYAPLLADFSQASFLPTCISDSDPENLLYVAPELLNSHDATEEGDVYAFGMLMFRCYYPGLPLIMDDDQELDLSRPNKISELIGKGTRPKKPEFTTPKRKKPEQFPKNVWDLICRCWQHDHTKRPKFQDILKELQAIYIFPKEKRRLVEFQKYVESLNRQNDGREGSHEEKYRLLFSEAVYINALSALSARIVSDCASVSERHVKASELVFHCKYCDVSYKLAFNCETEMWEAFQKGEHAGHNDKALARPLKQFLKCCVDAGLALGIERRKLTAYVSAETNTSVSRSTVNYYSRNGDSLTSLNAWKKIPSLVEKFREAGLRAELFYGKSENGDVVLTSVAFELPGASICKTDAFIGLVFVDGCSLSDRLRGTLLAMATITADHVLIPLFGVICAGERKDHYMKLLQFARESLPAKFTIMSDQGQGMASAYDELFSGSEGISRLPCMFHIWQSVSKQVRYDMKQLIICDHPDVYDAMLHVFRRDHNAMFEKYKDAIARMSFMSDSFGGIFEVKADSPIESLNAAILSYRHQGPFKLIQGMLSFAQGQLQYQENCLKKGSEMYCQSCIHTVEHRKELGARLQARREPGYYIVHEPFAIGLMVDYKVQVLGVLRCSCQGYERLGIPCRHMYAVVHRFPDEANNLPKITAIHHTNVIKEAVKKASKKVSFLDISEDESVQLPPPQRYIGRPPTRRWRPIREYMGARRKCTCGACGAKGHTRRSLACPCQNKVSKQPQRTDGFREQTAMVIMERRSHSVEPQRPPLAMTWNPSIEQGKQILEVEESIEHDKDKAFQALANGSCNLLDAFS